LILADRPEISVVIPTRDRWPVLSVTLAGALRQEDVDLEVIVVDDASVDDTPALLLALDEPRLRIVRHDTSQHVAATRNSGIAAASGDWIAFLDDDDLWAPHKLRRQLEAAIAGDAVFAWCSGLVVDESRTVTETWAAQDPSDLLARLLRGNWMPAGASNVIARAEVVRRLGGFDERLRHFADWDLWIRLAAAGPGAACPEPLVAYVRHDQNMILTDPRDLVRELDALADKHSALAASYGVSPDRVIPDRAGVLRWLGSGEARSGRRFRAAAYYLRAALRRSPYGRRRTLRDAGSALLGQVPTNRTPSIDPPLLDGSGWLSLYK
jgi:glycosyltransferase involved in cell wall biosynthesis